MSKLDVKWGKFEDIGNRKGVFKDMTWEAEDMSPSLEGFTESPQAIAIEEALLSKGIHPSQVEVYSENNFEGIANLQRVVFYINLNLTSKRDFKEVLKVYKQFNLVGYSDIEGKL